MINSAIRTSLITALILSVHTGIGSIAASAQSLFPDQAESVTQKSESFRTILVQLPQIEVNLEQTTEIVGQLAAPLQLNGQTVPIGAMVQLSLIPTEDGNAYLMASTIVLPSNGMAISISARGSVITGETITEKRGAEVGKENAAIGSYIGQSIVLAAGGDTEEAIQGGSALGTVSGIIGLVSPANRKVVRLVQGVYFLDLE